MKADKSNNTNVIDTGTVTSGPVRSNTDAVNEASSFVHIDTENEKVKRIIKAGYEVFSKNDLEKASTNMIVNRAEISRGLLYHYFKDKQELFDFLVYYSVKVVINDLKKSIDLTNGDILERIRSITVSKLKIAADYPYMFEFYQKYALSLSRSQITEYTESISTGIRDKFYNEGLDLSKVKDGIDAEKMVAVIRYTISGLSDELYNDVKKGELPPVDDIFKKLDSYIQFFRDLFYK